MNTNTIMVTGGAGFIGSALIRWLLANTNATVVNIDKLTYAGNLASIPETIISDRYHFHQSDICDQSAMRNLFDTYQPDAIMHLAAESHVDRSIDSGMEFVHTNIVGTAVLLETALRYWQSLNDKQAANFRFQHISTDEVYGSLGEQGLFVEETPYDPSSPYSASKASSDHLVRAWSRTYGMPILITNCSNNYGPYQFPEKLIPHMIIRAIHGETLPVYGKGENIRDWLFVDDHVKALYTVLKQGHKGETYNIGGNCEKTNIEVVKTICSILDNIQPAKDGQSYETKITYVDDRPGHDLRYAIDASKINAELNWQPEEKFEDALQQTVQWYLDNQQWWRRILDGSYQTDRLGHTQVTEV